MEYRRYAYARQAAIAESRRQAWRDVGIYPRTNSSKGLLDGFSNWAVEVVKRRFG